MALTAAAALASRSPFLSPPDAREAADRARSHFAGTRARAQMPNVFTHVSRVYLSTHLRVRVFACLRACLLTHVGTYKLRTN